MQLLPSWSSELGHDLFPEAPGIYMYSLQGNRDWAEWETKWTDLRRDGIHYGVMVEAMVDPRSRTRRKQNTRHLIQMPGSVHITAVWVCGRDWRDLESGHLVQPPWLRFTRCCPYLTMSQVWALVCPTWQVAQPQSLLILHGPSLYERC